MMAACVHLGTRSLQRRFNSPELRNRTKAMHAEWLPFLSVRFFFIYQITPDFEEFAIHRLDSELGSSDWNLVARCEDPESM